MANFYWVLANLVVPVLFAPLLLLLPWITGTPWRVIWQRLKASIADGQLLWAAIGIGATGAYDAGMGAWAGGEGKLAACKDNFLGIPYCDVMVFVFLLLVLTSSYVVKNAAERALDYEEEVRLAFASGGLLPKKSMGIVMLFSIFITGLIIWLYWLLKFSTSTQ